MNLRLPVVLFVSLVAIGQVVRGVDGPLQARTWDFDTTIPAGGYRSQKWVDLEGGWNPKVQRGAVIDGVGFHGRAGIQHWQIEGAILRSVNITGKRGFTLTAVDSVLNECSLGKDDNWYFDWWSTRSKYTNCIFVKTFIRGDLPPLDYAAHAKNCTFYNVKLPWVGMKENPGGYLQSGDMGFEQCRFVDCEVPETFLAGTVKCVFESCQFVSKNHVWPKETTPIKVTAYYGGKGSAPKSFINGPLTVEFLPLPRDLQAGSTMAHTYSGGNVTLQALPMPTQFTMIGTAPKKSSEIPSAAAPARPVAGAAPKLAPLPPMPAAAGGRADFRSINEVIGGLPPRIELKKDGQFSVSGATAANDWLAENAKGKTAAVRVMVEGVQAIKDEGYAFKITGREQAIIVNGNTVPARFVALFRAGPAEALVGVAKNRDLPIRGTVQKAVLEGQGRSLALTVTLGEAQTP